MRIRHIIDEKFKYNFSIITAIGPKRTQSHTDVECDHNDTCNKAGNLSFFQASFGLYVKQQRQVEEAGPGPRNPGTRLKGLTCFR